MLLHTIATNYTNYAYVNTRCSCTYTGLCSLRGQAYISVQSIVYKHSGSERARHSEWVGNPTTEKLNVARNDVSKFNW
jgi:hypothetical protein